jgi:osmotically-inducible protein OsmY
MSTGVPMADAQLADRVHSVLERSPFVPHRTLRFETSEGQVTLHGRVQTYYQKQMAQELLRGVEGLDRIENHVEVSWHQ